MVDRRMQRRMRKGCTASVSCCLWWKKKKKKEEKSKMEVLEVVK